MSINGHGAEACQWLWLILLAILEGFFLTTLALRYKVIYFLVNDPNAPEVWLAWTLIIASECLTTIGNLAAIFKLLFVSRTDHKRRTPSHLPWWCGR